MFIKSVVIFFTLSVYRLRFPWPGVWLFVVALNLPLFNASSRTPISRISSSAVFLQVFLGRSGGRLPSISRFITLLIELSFSLLLTRPNNLNLRSLITVSTSSISHLLATSSVQTLSLKDTPAIYLSHLQSQLVIML